MSGRLDRIEAQLHVTRGILVTPVTADTTGGSATPVVSGLIEAQRGYGSVDNGQAWNIKSAVLVQIHRAGARSALLGLFANELTSNPYNKLGYNPRGSIWEENVLFFQRLRRLDWYAGLFFRSRHELDAATPVNELAPDSVVGPTARVIGISGYRGALLLSGPRHWRMRARAQLQIERYWHWKEIRIPEEAGGPYWPNASTAATLGGSLSRAARSAVVPYSRGWITTVVFNRKQQTDRSPRFEINGRIEAGLRFGRHGGLDVFGAYERFFDEMSRPRPVATGVGYVGARFSAATLSGNSWER